MPRAKWKILKELHSERVAELNDERRNFRRNLARTLAAKHRPTEHDWYPEANVIEAIEEALELSQGEVGNAG